MLLRTAAFAPPTTPARLVINAPRRLALNIHLALPSAPTTSTATVMPFLSAVIVETALASALASSLGHLAKSALRNMMPLANLALLHASLSLSATCHALQPNGVQEMDSPLEQKKPAVFVSVVIDGSRINLLLSSRQMVRTQMMSPPPFATIALPTITPLLIAVFARMDLVIIPTAIEFAPLRTIAVEMLGVLQETLARVALVNVKTNFVVILALFVPVATTKAVNVEAVQFQN